MTHFRLHGPSQSNHTLVSDQFLDNYMPTANGEYVKVYLYLLRCLKSSTQELSIPLIGYLLPFVSGTAGKIYLAGILGAGVLFQVLGGRLKERSDAEK